MTPLQQLARERIDGIGAQQYGPYVAGRYSVRDLVRMTEEELADAHAYAVEFLLQETGDVEAAAVAAAALEGAWAALEPMRKLAAAASVRRPGRGA